MSANGEGSQKLDRSRRLLNTLALAVCTLIRGFAVNARTERLISATIPKRVPPKRGAEADGAATALAETTDGEASVTDGASTDGAATATATGEATSAASGAQSVRRARVAAADDVAVRPRATNVGAAAGKGLAEPVAACSPAATRAARGACCLVTARPVRASDKPESRAVDDADDRSERAAEPSPPPATAVATHGPARDNSPKTNAAALTRAPHRETDILKPDLANVVVKAA